MDNGCILPDSYLSLLISFTYTLTCLSFLLQSSDLCICNCMYVMEQLKELVMGFHHYELPDKCNI